MAERRAKETRRKSGGGGGGNGAEEEYPACIGRILNECQQSYALHRHKIKELVRIRRDHAKSFMQEWWTLLRPAFLIIKREPAVERVVKFAASFAAFRDEKHGEECDAFLEGMFGILLFSSDANNKAIRFRACQMLSEIIIRLPDDAEVSNEVWDELIDCMQRRIRDKVALVRVFAARALARFANDVDNNANIVKIYTEALASETNSEVRKMLVLSIPPSNATAVDIIQRTLDVNDSVRKTAYRVLANKFPIQSLSIKQRTTILQRGLADRVASVTAECVKMMNEAWLAKCCNADPITLLKYLDVETNESVGVAVMEEILKTGLVQVKDGQSIRQFIPLEENAGEDDIRKSVELMDAETALYWRLLCRHLQSEAQKKGSDAATTQGAEAVVYAAVAVDQNELLDRILPSTVAEYVRLVEVHLSAGPNYRFVSRQLLLLGLMLDYSDAASRKVASGFLQKLFYRPIEHAIDEEDGKDVVIGDGVSLGGDRDWARAVTELARKIHASSGEFDEVIATVVADIGRPCREGGAEFLQWMHSLSVTGLALENIKSLQRLQGKSIEAAEILHGLLLPSAKHIHVEVRRAAIRCLGIYGLRERRPSEQVVKQLRLAFSFDTSPVRIMAAKALFDLCMWYGPTLVDKSVQIGLGFDSPAQMSDSSTEVTAPTLSEATDAIEKDSNMPILDLLSSGLDRDDWTGDTDSNDNTLSTWGVLAEGFAKLLLQSKRYPAVISRQSSLFAKLICLYFSEETKDLHRLRQCLSVFFDQYAALSADHKKCISKSFIPVMRSVWPGIYGNANGSSHIVSALRKRASNISFFMLELLKAPLYNAQNETQNTMNDVDSLHDGDEEKTETKSGELTVDCGMEELAISIAVEVACFPSKMTAPAKCYIVALCKVAALLDFRPTEQDAIKCMRKLLNHLLEAVSADKQAAKELEAMVEHLKVLDKTPEQGLSEEQIKTIIENLDLQRSIDVERVLEDPVPAPPAKTPMPKRASRRRQQRSQSSDSDSPPVIPLPTTTPGTIRAARESKTAALGRIMNTGRLDEVVPGDIDKEELDVIARVSSEDKDDSDSNDTEYEVEVSEEVKSAAPKIQPAQASVESSSDDNQTEKDVPKSKKKKALGKSARETFSAYEGAEGDSDFDVMEKPTSVSTRRPPNSTTRAGQSKKQSATAS